MTPDNLSSLLRSATEDDVLKALEAGCVDVPLMEPTELLEFYNCMLDVMTHASEDAERAARHRIPPGFGSTD